MRLRIDGKVYRFDARGYVVTGWYREGDQWCYYGRDGAQVFGWTRIRGTWHYFDPSSGVMRTGWLTEGGYTYYLSPSGAMVTGPRWIDGKRYVFDRSGPAADVASLRDLPSRRYRGRAREDVRGPGRMGRGVVVGGCFAVIFGSGGDGGIEAVVRQVDFVYDIRYG